MDIKSTAKFLLISPRKARLVADEIRGYSYPEAMDTLRFIPRKTSLLLSKVLKSARSSADDSVKDADLYVKKVYVDEGPTLKRFRPRAKGRGMQRLKRTSHITVVLSNN
ncbi:MAG: 50S ribosomal protein L22 [Spirochaetia bacterium]|nr:50S ribosomal protein L22 [Spirochaetia bacterium]